MIYFKSPASATFFTTKKIGLEIIGTIGREDIASGFITKEEVADTLQIVLNKNHNDNKNGQKSNEESVKLAARLFPFIKMLEDAEKAFEFVYWVEEI